MKVYFLGLSILFLFIGFIPYLRDIKKKKIKTQIVSWIGWTLISLLGGIAMLSDTFNWGGRLCFS